MSTKHVGAAYTVVAVGELEAWRNGMGDAGVVSGLTSFSISVLSRK